MNPRNTVVRLDSEHELRIQDDNGIQIDRDSGDVVALAMPGARNLATALVPRVLPEVAALMHALNNLLDACYEADAEGELPSVIDGLLLDAANEALTSYTRVFANKSVSA